MAASKARSSDKTERRARRKRKERARGPQLSAHDGWLDPEEARRLRRAIRTIDPTAWTAVAPMVLPILKRTWHPYPAELRPMRIQVPPGIPTGFGIDLGPAFSHVTPDLLTTWGIDTVTLLATALDNLRALVRREPPVVDRLVHDGIDILAVQGQGWGSALVLLPDVLGPILGPQPRLLLAPVRNTLIALPDTVEPEFVVDVWEAIAVGAHDAIDMDPLRWTGSAVVAWADLETRGLPN